MRGKGCDRDEVVQFLAQVAEQLENEILEKEKLKKKMEKLREDLARYEQKDDILRETLIAAQKFSQEIRNNAEKEAQLILKEAEIKSGEMITDAMNRRQNLREDIRNLKFKRQEMENDIIHMLNSLKELIETYRGEDQDFDKIEYMTK